MNDLISRQAAIDAIGKKSDEIYKTKQKGATYPHDDFFQGMAYAESVVKQLPPAQPELPWIPCKKQLPVKEGDYFVTVDPRYVPPGYRSTDVITWRDGKWVMADYFVLDSEGRKEPDFKVVELDVPIIAWMPLPEPYAERRNDE